MKARIVADGPERLHGCPDFRTRLKELRESVEARYATEWAEAGFFGRLVLRWRIASEYRRERRKLVPSEYSLFGRHGSERTP